MPSLAAILASGAIAVSVTPAFSQVALSSWVDGATKTKIESFIESVADPASPNFLPVEDRIAVFDIDGTLWSERPFYPDAQFVGDRVAALANEHPEWAKALPFAPIVAGNMDVLNYIASTDFVRMMAASRAGLTLDEFHTVVSDWFANVDNTVKNKPQSKLTYTPMLELMALLEEKEFTSYLVTGADEEFIRAISGPIFGIPRERVIGSGLALDVAEGEDGVSLSWKGAVGTDNNGPGKVVQISEVVGRKPIFAAGNSDGDFMMMRWTTTGETPSMAVMVLHDDPDREFPASRPKKGGAALDTLDNWVSISMKSDWTSVYPE